MPAKRLIKYQKEVSKRDIQISFSHIEGLFFLELNNIYGNSSITKMISGWYLLNLNRRHKH